VCPIVKGGATLLKVGGGGKNLQAQRGKQFFQSPTL
jgi:hypothetical protein